MHLCRIAIVYEKQGKLPEALELYQKALNDTLRYLHTLENKLDIDLATDDTNFLIYKPHM